MDSKRNEEMETEREMQEDVVIVGTGAAGLFAALNLPRDRKILIITKKDAESSDSFLAQGGICVLKDESDYESYFEDTMRAGHYENRKESVDIMIRSSREIIRELIGYGVKFERRESGREQDAPEAQEKPEKPDKQETEGQENFLDDYAFTREGAHSRPRILFHEDVTGKEITSKLLAQVRSLENVRIMEYTTMTDIIVEETDVQMGENGVQCAGIIAEDVRGNILKIRAPYTILASGGIGGLYEHSTNYPHLTGDALRIAEKHGIRLEHLDYVQIHPTTLYSKKPGRRFLISESVRGEGAILLDKNGKRFTDELQPRDVVTAAIREQMEKDGTDHVWLSMERIDKDTILNHFPNIYEHCLEEGYDVTKEWIPVVPAQHYFMGGIWVDSDSQTSMEHLFAAGETSCNGVHGANRLASNSLLESLVFAKRAAQKITAEPDAGTKSAGTESGELEETA
jgi:L-aspartate oxidase